MKPAHCLSRTVAATLLAILIVGLGAGTAAAVPMLSAEKTDALLIDADGDGQAEPGDQLRYSVVIANSGDTDALGAAFSDVLDLYTTLLVGSVSTTLGVVTSGNSVGDTSIVVSLGTIAPSATVTIVFDAEIDLGVPDSVTEINNQGIVTSRFAI